MSEQGPPPGWYPHPEMANTVRYWNGATFTGETAPAQIAAPATGEVSDTLQTVGWICAFVFPAAGFIIGCMCIAQGPKDEGWWMAAISVLFAGAAVYFMAQALAY